MAQELALGREDPHRSVRNMEHHSAAPMRLADRQVAEHPAMAQRPFAVLVDTVAADPKSGSVSNGLSRWSGLRPVRVVARDHLAWFGPGCTLVSPGS